MTENKELAAKNVQIEEKLEEFKILHSHLGKMKG